MLGIAQILISKSRSLVEANAPVMLTVDERLTIDEEFPLSCFKNSHVFIGLKFNFSNLDKIAVFLFSKINEQRFGCTGHFAALAVPLLHDGYTSETDRKKELCTWSGSWFW